MWLKTKFNHGDYCYTWAIFDCCRSIYKGKEALTTIELDGLSKQKEKEEEKKESSRSESEDSDDSN